MKEKLVQLHARLAFHDGDDALVILDRRQARDLHLVGEADEDAALLRLGDELVHGAGAHVPVLRDVEPPDVATRADGFEDRVRTGDRLAHRLMRRRRLVRAGGDAPDGLAVPLLAAGARTPLTTALRRASGPARAAAPAHGTTLTLRLSALVTRELARLLALFAGREGLRTERRRAELRTGCAELRTGAGRGRPRRAEAGTTAATSTSAAASSPSRAVRIPELRGRRRA